MYLDLQNKLNLADKSKQSHDQQLKDCYNQLESK